MRDLGAFLSNLRSSAGLSLETLAMMVGSNKSTISRLENDMYVQPFRGSIRKLVIILAEILCTSEKETERYLEIARIDRSLLTEIEAIQLGAAPHIAANTPEETSALEHLDQLYTQLLIFWKEREKALGISNTPQILKLKIQEYTNTLQEIQKHLDTTIQNEEPKFEEIVQEAKVNHTIALNGRLVVGQQHGESFCADGALRGLYTLASPNARWMLQQTDYDCFAVDDCIILANSKNFRGWTTNEIETTLLDTPMPILMISIAYE